MKGKKKDLGASACAIARSLNIVGDWWSLLIVRDALAGVRRFGEFQKKLGLAKNILSARLRKLSDAGILQSVAASDGSAYNEYQLTPKGEQLYLVLVALWQWGEKYSFAAGEQDTFMVDRANLRKLLRLELRASDGRTIGPKDYTSRREPRRGAKPTRRRSVPGARVKSKGRSPIERYGNDK
jgi:DNA-binding HxlR family transcriptional regulator